MIKYLTKSGNLHVLQMLDKSVTVEETPESEGYNGHINQRYSEYGGVSIYDDFTVSANRKALSTIVVAIELVREIKKL